MISRSNFTDLKSNDKLILVKRPWFNFELGEVFLFSSYEYSNKINLFHIRSKNHFTFTEDAVSECFSTLQSIRSDKITEILS